MDIKKLPSVKLYRSGDALVSVPTLSPYMSRLRFWALWRNLHVIRGMRSAKEGVSYKIKNSTRHTQSYFPGMLYIVAAQEFSVDESMIKYKGHIRGKIIVHA